MLTKLHIQNYAIIEQLDIKFSPDLNIITGETGAGKSILMGALNLILGERADNSVLQQDSKKCIIEGFFQVTKSKQLSNFFSAYDLDEENEIVLRREISAAGKSRNFINDTPANLSQLKELAVLLVDLHQQFDTADLSNEIFQRNVLDALSNNAALLLDLSQNYNAFTTIKKELDRLYLLQANARKELDYNQFLFNELEELNLQEDELENLDAELNLLNNAENIKQQLSGIYYDLKDSEQPVVQQLKIMLQKVNALQQYHPDIEMLQQRMNSAIIEIKDVADELERIDNSVTYDAERISIINDRITSGYKLQKKHGVTTTKELIELKDGLEGKLRSVLNVTENIEKLENEAGVKEKKAIEFAKIISVNRGREIDPFLEKVNNMLLQVGMPNARLKVTLNPGMLSINGSDVIEFLFDANKSGRFEPLRKVASGGELSRLMLIIKSLVAQKLQLPTLIFDEIDTGISGEAARQVGIIMKTLSAGHQIISITHQPQIAAKADTHHFVYKEIKDDKIVTAIRLLSNDERITTIAQMLSGEKPTAAALENAREMVGN
ncbi:MAG: DNA repair protein RecN [Ferruginibacter sp.]